MFPRTQVKIEYFFCKWDAQTSQLKTFPIPCNSYYDTSFITRFHLFIVTTPSLHKLIHKIEYFFVTEKHKKHLLPPSFWIYFAHLTWGEVSHGLLQFTHLTWGVWRARDCKHMLKPTIMIFPRLKAFKQFVPYKSVQQNKSTYLNNNVPAQVYKTSGFSSTPSRRKSRKTAFYCRFTLLCIQTSW